MQMLSVIFLRIVGMGITASFVIVIVMLVRWLLKRFPKSFAYMLWILVAFRLMVPVSFGSDISIYNFLAEKDNIVGLRSSILPSESAEDSFNNNDNDGYRNGENDEFAFVDSEQSADGVYAESDTEHIAEINHTWNQRTQSVNADENKIVTDSFIRNRQLIWMAALIWLAGVVTLVSYSVVTYLRLRRKMNHSICLSDNVYESDRIRSPFVMGICSPKIYIPFRLSEKERQCILLHERYHIRRRDYIVKCFAFALVQIYWFHPLVWISYHMMCSDMEMSCDEKVISELGSSMKKEYSSSLLAFAVNKRQPSAGPLAFGEGNVMNRVKNVLQYQKPAKWKTAIGVTVVILTMAACATDANKMDNGQNAEADKLQNMTQMSEYDRFANNQSENSQDKNSYGQKDNESEAETKGVIERQPAQWAENSMHDLEFYTLDYADQDKIVFHISNGLFAYNLQERRITDSLDLKALNCQEVQTGGECKIEIYEGSEGRLKAVIMPYPHVIEDSYIYDFETKELAWYDASVLAAKLACVRVCPAFGG
ncbi:MAG: hypothetical protein J6D08_05225 [Lachnospiraceae bacterium]|nr:hypothetical protein [Lachnospiraceae bacterium]